MDSCRYRHHSGLTLTECLMVMLLTGVSILLAIVLTLGRSRR